MLDENPYRATLLSETKSAITRVVVALWWFVYLHPAISLALIYTCWMLTTTSLGRPPGFGEHPDTDAVHGAVHVLGITAALLTIAGPILIPVAFVWGFAQPFAQWPPGESTITKRIACLATYLLMLAIVMFVYSSDPFGALYWFWD